MLYVLLCDVVVRVVQVDNGGVCKLADFGAAVGVAELTSGAEGHKSIHGTPYWMVRGAARRSMLWRCVLIIVGCDVLCCAVLCVCVIDRCTGA